MSCQKSYKFIVFFKVLLNLFRQQYECGVDKASSRFLYECGVDLGTTSAHLGATMARWNSADQQWKLRRATDILKHEAASSYVVAWHVHDHVQWRLFTNAQEASLKFAQLERGQRAAVTWDPGFVHGKSSGGRRWCDEIVEWCGSQTKALPEEERQAKAEAAALAVVGLETGCDDFDSDVEVIGARLHGVNVYGNGLIVGQVLKLCRALGHEVLRPVKAEPLEEDGASEVQNDPPQVREEEEEEAYVKLRRYSVVASVRDVCHSHDSIQHSFNDGKTFENLIGQLTRGEVDPLCDKFLHLQMWLYRGKLISQNNRRLYCLKKYQDSCTKDVKVHIDVVELNSIVEKFVSDAPRVRQNLRL